MGQGLPPPHWQQGVLAFRSAALQEALQSHGLRVGCESRYGCRHAASETGSASAWAHDAYRYCCLLFGTFGGEPHHGPGRAGHPA
eukprot:4505913-Alexandrium_andersonii.AAC.1